MLQQNVIINYYSDEGVHYGDDNNKESNNNHKKSTTKPSVLSSEVIVVKDEDQKQQQYYRGKLLQLTDFNEAFELAKSTIETKFKMHRAGLSLILQGLPTNLGAYHILGSNLIIVNKRILDIIRKYKSHEEYNSYLFMVLVHEYLHSLGVIDEIQVRNMTYALLSSLLGEGHIATKMARYQPWDLFPELRLFQNNSFEQKFETIKNFDKKTQSYIG